MDEKMRNPSPRLIIAAHVETVIIGASFSGISSLAHRILSENPSAALVVCEAGVEPAHVLIENKQKTQQDIVEEIIKMAVIDFDRLVLEDCSLKYDWFLIPELTRSHSKISFPKVLPFKFNKQQYVNSRFRPRSSIHVKKSR